MTDKEVNSFLIDQLRIVQQAAKIARDEGAEKTVSYLQEEENYIEQKLYQKPPIIKQ